MADTTSYFYMRIKENFFDGDEIKILESMPDGYLYSNILLKMYLNSLKNSGRLMLNEYIPYSPEMIASITRHQIGTVQRALEIFKKMGLIEVLDNGAIYMLNIQQYIGKSSDEADRKREYRQRIEAEKKALLKGEDKCPKNVREISDKRVAYIDTDIELKKDIDIYNNSLSNDKEYIESDVEPVITDSTPDAPIDSNLTHKDDLNIVDEELHPKRDRIDYRGIQNDYNAICVSFPMCKLLSDKRKKEIKACVNNGITRADFRRAFEKAQESSFMKGNNNRGWQASFDWIIKLNNLVKILDGNYDNKQNTPTSTKFTPKSEVKEELNNFYTEINEWANKGN